MKFKEMEQEITYSLTEKKYDDNTVYFSFVDTESIIVIYTGKSHRNLGEKGHL